MYEQFKNVCTQIIICFRQFIHEGYYLILKGLFIYTADGRQIGVMTNWDSTVVIARE